MDRVPETIELLRARHCCAGTPRSFAPASRSAIRPAAPARLNTGKSENTELLPPVIITPHFGPESTAENLTFFQSASSSSASVRASAVPICCPISARMVLTVTMPSRSILYQMLGSNAPPGDAGIASAKTFIGAKPKATPVPATLIRKLRRDNEKASSTVRCRNLTIDGSLRCFCSSLFNRLADADIRHATAKISCHNSVNVLVAWCWKVLQQ